MINERPKVVDWEQRKQMEEKELEEFRELEGKLENPNDRYAAVWQFIVLPFLILIKFVFGNTVKSCSTRTVPH